MQDTEHALVELQRSAIDDGELCGYVVGESEAFVLLHHFGDSLSLDGYVAVRKADVQHSEEAFPRRGLVEHALSLKGQFSKVPEGIVLTGVVALLESVQKLYGAVVIQRELVCPGECEIETVRISSDKSYVLRWLTPEAIWESDDRAFRFEDITLVGFDGEYERTLVHIAQHNDRVT